MSVSMLSVTGKFRWTWVVAWGLLAVAGGFPHCAVAQEDGDLQTELRPVPLDETSPQSTLDCPPPGDPATTPRPLSSIRIVMPKSEGGVPKDCSGHLFASQSAPGGLNIGTQFHWQPTNFFHQPLYFDDQPLERYGQTSHPFLQPVVSGVRFYSTFAIVPYKMGFNGIHDGVTTMGYYRPGGPAPCVRERYPFTLKGAFLETGAALGLVFLTP